MTSKPRLTATTLTLLLAGGALSADPLIHPVLSRAALVPIEGQKAHRTALATQHLLSQKAQLGLGAQDDLRLRSASVNGQGQTIVRYEQVHQGYRVWGTGAVVRVQPEGRTETTAKSLQANISLAVPPRLSAAAAMRIAHEDLAPKGAYLLEPKAEQIVFPSRCTGNLKIAYNPVTKRYELDRAHSVLAPKPTAEHVWAYEVVSMLHNLEDGTREMHTIIDATTGAVLRKWDGVQTFEAATPSSDPHRSYASGPVAPARVAPMRLHVSTTASSRSSASPEIIVPVGTAAVGTGHSQYSGDVKLDTNANATGGFDLIDRTRGVGANPYLDFQGNTTLFEDETNYPYNEWWAYQDQYSDSDDTWGDGQDYADPIYPGHGTDANGQTAAVDAHYGMSTTWDFYKNIFNRNGIDDLGTSIGGVVHAASPFGFTEPLRWDNAMWTTYIMMMVYGDGTYTPTNSSGFLCMTELDITGHEMSHGVTAFSAALNYEGESGGLNEANSDILGSMVEAYATRPSGTDTAIPDTGTDWMMGVKVGQGTPLRWMWKPSKDGISADNWYYGVHRLDVHYSSGPMNRCFYFLSQGASDSSSDETYSPYLPAGMTGIGNDSAARIWYKALTEYLTADSDYAAARDGSLSAATDLFGAASAEVTAVENAFAAINVGSAHGEAARVHVVPAEVSQEVASVYDGEYASFLKVPIAPQGETIQLSLDVQNTTNTAVNWELGTFKGSTDGWGDFYYEGGIINPDGSWTVPHETGKAFGLRGYSVADPLEFAEIIAFSVNVDTDEDLESDAVDGGTVALSWYLAQSVTPSASPYGNVWVDDFDVALFNTGFRNAFGK